MNTLHYKIEDSRKHAQERVAALGDNREEQVKVLTHVIDYMCRTVERAAIGNAMDRQTEIDMSEDCRIKLEQARIFAISIGARVSFESTLARLCELGKTSGVKLYLDSAPHSFGFSACGMVGGLIYHDSDKTWSLHT